MDRQTATTSRFDYLGRRAVEAPVTYPTRFALALAAVALLAPATSRAQRRNPDRLPSFRPQHLDTLAPQLSRGTVGFIELRRGGPLSAVLLATEVHASADEVISVIADPARYPRFMPAISDVTVTERQGESVGFRWRWRTAIFQLAGRGFITVYRPPPEHPERGARIELQRIEGDLGTGREIWRIIPKGPNRTLVTFASRMDIRNANYLTRSVAGRSRSVNRSVNMAMSFGVFLRSTEEAERRAGHERRPPPHPLTRPDVDVTQVADLLARGDLVFVEANGNDLVQTAVLARLPQPDERVAIAMRDPEAFTDGMTAATSASITSIDDDGTHFDWVFDVPLIGSRGSMVLHEEDDAIHLDAVRGAMDGGRWRFDHDAIDDRHTAVTGWARFDGCRQVDMLSGLRQQARFTDRRQKPGRRPVVEKLWRVAFWQIQLNLYRMPLIRPDTQSIFAKCKALLVIGEYNFVQRFADNRATMLRRGDEQFLDVNPPAFIQSHANRFGLVAQHQAQELTGSDRLFFHCAQTDR